MKLIIAGGRDIVDPVPLMMAMDKYTLNGPYISEIVSGGATGVDKMGEQWGRDRGLKVTVFEAQWKKHGKAAGPIRNELMARYADALVAIWDGASRGTAHMIGAMRALNKMAYVWRV
jgi:hypothetical protein